MLDKDFREFVELLNSTNVEYLLVGGYALAAHGHPRYTGDIDFWVNPTPGNAARLMSALAQFGFGNAGLSERDFLQPDAVGVTLTLIDVDDLRRQQACGRPPQGHRRSGLARRLTAGRHGGSADAAADTLVFMNRPRSTSGLSSHA